MFFIALLTLRWDGYSIKVRYDPLCGGPPLKENYPELYGIADNKDASVSKLLAFSGDSYHCNINFI